MTTIGTHHDGTPIEAVTLENGHLSARILTYGAVIHRLVYIPLDRPVIVSASDPLSPPDALKYAGALVGRFANRIGGGRFTVDGKTFQTDQNENDSTTLHGGSDGLHCRNWTLDEAGADFVTLSHALPDGHMGFPGEARLRVTYRLDGSALDMRAVAEVSAPGPISLAQHAYFNLSGGGDVAGHSVRIDAAHYLPVDAQKVPLGHKAPVDGTAFDFRSVRPLGDAAPDHNFCLSDSPQPLRPVAWVSTDDLAMTVETTEPGLQFYDGAHLGGAPGADGVALPQRAGMALETQSWPDAPNQPAFPNAILRPGETYENHTRYVFGQ